MLIETQHVKHMVGSTCTAKFSQNHDYELHVQIMYMHHIIQVHVLYECVYFLS